MSSDESVVFTSSDGLIVFGENLGACCVVKPAMLLGVFCVTVKETFSLCCWTTFKQNDFEDNSFAIAFTCSPRQAAVFAERASRVPPSGPE